MHLDSLKLHVIAASSIAGSGEIDVCLMREDPRILHKTPLRLSTSNDNPGTVFSSPYRICNFPQNIYSLF